MSEKTSKALRKAAGMPRPFHWRLTVPEPESAPPEIHEWVRVSEALLNLAMVQSGVYDRIIRSLALGEPISAGEMVELVDRWLDDNVRKPGG